MINSNQLRNKNIDSLNWKNKEKENQRIKHKSKKIFKN